MVGEGRTWARAYAAKDVLPDLRCCLCSSPGPSPIAPSGAPYPKPVLDEVVSAIIRLKNKKSPGCTTYSQKCATMWEMTREPGGGDDVHGGMHWVILGKLSEAQHRVVSRAT